MSTKSCDVHPGRKARHVFDRYTSIQSRMILAVEAKANGTKQEGTSSMSNTLPLHSEVYWGAQYGPVG